MISLLISQLDFDVILFNLKILTALDSCFRSSFFKNFFNVSVPQNIQVSAFKAVEKSLSAFLNRPMKSSLLLIVHRNKHGTG